MSEPREMKLKEGDIVQIVHDQHPWFPALLIVSEVKSWGVQAYALIPRSNDGSKPVGEAYNRLQNAEVMKVGEAAFGAE